MVATKSVKISHFDVMASFHRQEVYGHREFQLKQSRHGMAWLFIVFIVAPISLDILNDRIFPIVISNFVWWEHIATNMPLQ